MKYKITLLLITSILLLGCSKPMNQTEKQLALKLCKDNEGVVRTWIEVYRIRVICGDGAGRLILRR